MLRGGGSSQAITIPQLDEEEYDYSAEDGYYFLDDDEGGAAEYEYYEDDGDGDEYYYDDDDAGDDDAGDDDDEGYLYLPAADEAGDASHRKRKVPSVRKSLGAHRVQGLALDYRGPSGGPFGNSVEHILPSPRHL